jgi:ATP-binding cassette subfamily B protein/subfamily B ATP-binding cassette protein MsbA
MTPIDSSKKRFRAFRAGKSANAPKDVAREDSAHSSDRRRQRRQSLREYRRWLWPYKGSIVVVFLLALLGAGLSMILPLATRYIIDDVLTASDVTATIKTNRLIYVCAAMVALLLISQIIDTSRSYLMSLLNAKVIFRLRQKLFDRFLRLPLGELGGFKSGGVVSRLSQDTDKVTGMLQMALITPGVAVIRVALTVAVLLVISWQMAAIAGAMIPPIVLINLLWIRKVRPIYRDMAEVRSRIDARVTETFGGIRVVRAFRRERKEQRDYAVSHHAVIRQNLLAEKLRLVVSTGWGLLIPATSLAVVGFGGYRVIQGLGTIGDIVAFQMYAFMLLHPVSQIVNSLSATQQALAALERVFEILDKPAEKPDAIDAVTAPRDIEEMCFDAVSFEYREGLPVLRDISLSVPAGSVVALVGPSGGGKTTLVDLVARFHDPTSGSIRLNGVDLRKIRLESYRNRLAVVPQEVFLFDGTVADNIIYGRRSADRDAVISASRRANAHNFIAELPEGYDTLIGERGIKLSGGQRQRLSIARAILADPDILILDEATSNLDTESEQLIQASLTDLLTSRTTFVIAHRLSTITHADIIIVLCEGRIVQTGQHAQLINQEGPYREMVQRQQRLATADALEWE